MMYDYDVVVIGGGAAGLTAAGMAAVLGAKTLLIEADKLGGDCTWYGCVPSKSLIRAARVAHHMRTAARFGLSAADPEHDLAQVMARVRAIREQIYQDADAPPNLEKLGVEVRKAWARFLDPHTLELTESAATSKLTSRYFVLATGSIPRMPPLDGAEHVPIFNNETIFELEQLPKYFVVAGGGPVGIEMAQAFSMLGAAVSVVSQSTRILERDDAELSASLREHLQGEGIRFVLDTGIARIEKKAVYTKNGVRLEADALLVAVGRRPNIQRLNLDAAGVRTNDYGIIVDRHCCSSVKHIYACGDVAGRYLFTHMAEHMAKTAVLNAILRIPVSMDERHVTWCTFTDPELAHVGRNEEELKRNGEKYFVYRFPFTRLDRAITDSQTSGCIKVLASRWGRILGVSVLGANAGEMIAEYALAMRHGVRLSGVSATIHPYPTYVLGNQRAADLYMMGKLTPRMVRWMQRLFGLRGSTRGVRALNAG